MNLKNLFLMMAVAGVSSLAQAKDVSVDTLRHAGPYVVRQPLMIDSTDVKSNKFDVKKLLDTPLRLELAEQGDVTVGGVVPAGSGHSALHLLGFSVTNAERMSVKISVDGLKDKRIFVDGNQVSANEVTLEPSTHKVVVKYLTTTDGIDTVKVKVTGADGKELKVGDIADIKGRSYNIYDVLHATRFSGVSLSPDGKYAIYGKRFTRQGGQTSSATYVRELSSGRIVDERTGGLTWMPRTNKYYYIRTLADRSREIVAVDPATRQTEVIAENVPEGRFTMAPSEDYLIVYTSESGPAEDRGVYEVIEPEDRQPGWRTRQNLALFDMKTGLQTPLTFGHHSVWASDISADGKKILLMTSESRLTARPTTINTLMLLDVESMDVDTLVCKDGFISSARFSPDATEIVISGSPECLGGIGKNVKEGQTPSMIDQQLYIMSLADKKVRPVTKHFNPCVQNFTWNRGDGQIYFNAEDKDCINLFRLNPKNGSISRINLPEEMVSSFDVADNARRLAFYGQSASNSDRLYTLDTKSLKVNLVEDLSAETLRDVTLGECLAWNYINPKGDTICCRYYLPPHFDGQTKLPMIVNYYGGCSPTSRNFESRYPHHAYAALGYAVLVINPSGATGFGQEFSARHVNTAGEGVADDIIGATRQFCKEHAYVNEKKIGCIGASYGGFMTMYLQTVTDLFAAAISHAGISDHTSYWGEGYWGYSYSEVSMANSYPWTDKRLFVDQSPLFNADKVRTPLLFLHGAADNNVPVGESIQMYTALKLLGRETAMVLVSDQDHHITDYAKRLRWQNTIYAWFAKWLKDDASWWNEIYKQKDL
ncbi:MAG: S9 family peptidase [Bacteroidaceae bacterium]|nr:S9 family peptidase [Bacteroidaceae bacterium]